MAKNRKDNKIYSDKIVVADASPLINLYKIDKLSYLKLLFSEVYTTETVKRECKFELPSWIRIKEPTKNMTRLISGEGIDRGEKTAIALVLHLDVLQSDNIVKGRQSLILDDKRAEWAIKSKKLDIDCIKLRDVFSLAYDKKLFSREEGLEMFRMLRKEGRRFTNKDLNFIFGEQVSAVINKGTKR